MIVAFRKKNKQFEKTLRTYNMVTTTTTTTTKKKKKKKKRKLEPEPESIVDMTDDLCSCCGDGGTLLECEHSDCGLFFHMSCVGLTRIPKGVWICPRHQGSSSKTCSFCPARIPSDVSACSSCVSPRSELARLLRFALSKVIHKDIALPFRGEVDRRECPDYYEIISNPIDLGKIIAKVQNSKYTKLDQFQSDIDLLVSNCEIYCEGRYPHLVENAQEIQSIFVQTLEKYTVDSPEVLSFAKDTFARLKRGWSGVGNS